jgi:hypothetical protein
VISRRLAADADAFVAAALFGASVVAGPGDTVNVQDGDTSDNVCGTEGARDRAAKRTAR